MKKLNTKVENYEKEANVEKNTVRVDERQHRIIFEENTGFLIEVNNKTYKVDDLIRLEEEGMFRVEIQGYTIDVKVEDPVMSAIGGGLVKDGNVEAPMSGQISKIAVKEGETVKDGQLLLTISAMKMENTIVSPMDGVVKEINVIINENVNSGRLLVVVDNS